MLPQIYNFKDALRGDTFNGVQFTLKKADNTPIDLTGYSIKMDIKAEKGSTTLTLSTSNSKIEITDAINGVFRINPFIVNLTKGVYIYDIQFTKDIVVKTYLSGNWTIIDDITK